MHAGIFNETSQAIAAESKGMQSKRLLELMVVGIWLITQMPISAHASTVDLFGYGSRGLAMGGAIATTARGHAAAYYNPAALALAKAPSFSVGYQYAAFNLEMTTPDLSGNKQFTDHNPALVFGFGIPLPFGGVLQDRLSLGFGFVLPQGALLLADASQPSTPSFPLLEARAQTLSVQLSMGVNIIDKVSVGFGALVLATLDGNIDAQPNSTGTISAQVQNSLKTHISPVVGILPGPWANLNFALTWRNESLARYKIPVTATVPIAGIDYSLALNIAGVAQYDPQRATFEVSYQGIEFISFSAAVTYRAWSQFENPIEYFAIPDDYPAQPGPDFKDTIVPRLGMEMHWALEKWLIEPRLGYSFEPTPAPEQTGFHNYLSNNRHLVTSGIGIQFGDFTLDLAGQFHVLEHRTHNKDPDRADELENNPGFPSISHEGLITVWSVDLGIAF